MSIGQSDAVRNPRISARTATWLAWSLWVACVVLIALALLLDFLTDYVPLLSGERLGPGLAVLAGVLSLAYPTVGALIASRLPTNLIGWLFFGLGLLYAVRRFTEAYADYALLVNFALPWGGVRGLVHDMDRIRGAGSGGGIPDAAVPRGPATVSSLAACGVDCALSSRVDCPRRRICAGTVAHTPLH